MDACNRSEHFAYEGAGTHADAGSDHRAGSGGRDGGRKDRPRRNVNRSGTDQHERDDCHVQTERSVAGGIDERRHSAAARRETAYARRHQYLDAADSKPHRHAVDRNSHAGRREGVRFGSADDRKEIGRDRARPARRARRRGSVCGENYRRAVPGNSYQSKRGGAIRHQCRRCPGCD